MQPVARDIYKLGVWRLTKILNEAYVISYCIPLVDFFSTLCDP
jgi:hypothetical protein